MKYTFHAKGHPNILATHKNTLEFTKDAEVSKEGDCIVGVSADFETKKLRMLAERHKQFSMKITCAGISDSLDFTATNDFCSDTELVIRLSDFPSERTFGTRASKSAKHIDRALVKKIAASGKIQIDIEPAIKAIIFDFDDTIEEFRNAKMYAHSKIAEHMLQEYGVYPDTTLKMMDDIDRKFAIAGVGASTSNYDRHNWFKDFFQRIGVKASASEIDSMTNLYWRFIIEAATPMPHTIETLKKIKDDYKIAVISDSDGEVRIKIERAKTVGVYPLVDLFITSDEIGKNKPNKALYDIVLAKFKLKPCECVMVGDKPQVDLKLAKELGMKTVWMKHGDWAEELDGDHFSYVYHEITDLRQLLEILKEM